MNQLVDYIMGGSTELDAAVLVRLILIMLALEFLSLIAAYLGNLKR